MGSLTSKHRLPTWAIVVLILLVSAGVTWSELYRALGVVSLTVLLAALLGVPLVSAIDPEEY